jgi:hypothetical protein
MYKQHGPRVYSTVPHCMVQCGTVRYSADITTWCPTQPKGHTKQHADGSMLEFVVVLHSESGLEAQDSI